MADVTVAPASPPYGPPPVAPPDVTEDLLVRKTAAVPTLALLLLAPTAHAAVSDQVKADSGIPERTREHLARAAGASLPGVPDLKPKPRPAAVPPQLQAIAACESGGDPRAVSSTGQYRGKYQFDTGTWRSVGGSGDPAAAPEVEQDHRAARLYARSGAGQWPVCGR